MRESVAARRQTADGVRVELWTDGTVTGLLGRQIRDVPMSRDPGVGWAVAGAVELYDADELPLLYRACRRVVRAGGPTGVTPIGAAFEELCLRRSVPFAWTVLHADRDGKPTERVSRLPRLRWPGLVVFDFCGGPHSARGRYQVYTVNHKDECSPTGCAFGRLIDLRRHLLGIEPEASA